MRRSACRKILPPASARPGGGICHLFLGAAFGWSSDLDAGLWFLFGPGASDVGSRFLSFRGAFARSLPSLFGQAGLPVGHGPPSVREGGSSARCIGSCALRTRVLRLVRQSGRRGNRLGQHVPMLDAAMPACSAALYFLSSSRSLTALPLVLAGLSVRL